MDVSAQSLLSFFESLPNGFSVCGSSNTSEPIGAKGGDQEREWFRWFETTNDRGQDFNLMDYEILFHNQIFCAKTEVKRDFLKQVKQIFAWAHMGLNWDALDDCLQNEALNETIQKNKKGLLWLLRPVNEQSRFSPFDEDILQNIADDLASSFMQNGLKFCLLYFKS